MKNLLSKQEESELNHLYFECPTCHEKYTELQAIRLRSKDNKFICSHCCPTDDFSKTISKPSFTLIESNSSIKLKEVRGLEKKIKEQLNASDIHDGILNLLADLRDVELIRNHPSDNIKRGIGSSRITDEQTLKEISENSKQRAIRKETVGQIQSFMGRDTINGKFELEIVSKNISSTKEDDMNVTSNEFADENLIEPPQKKVKSFPNFLLGSRVTGGSATSTSQSNNPPIIFNENVSETKVESVVKVELSPTPMVEITTSQDNEINRAEEEEDFDENINWEDGDNDS